MNFIPLINVLNISIILIMIIAFAKAANSKKNNVILFQLVDHETDKDYNAYVDKQLNKNEKKLNLYEYHRTVYNVKAVRVPSSSVKSFEMYKNDFYDYCENTYKDPEMASQEYNLKVLEDTLNFFFTCLIPERLNEIKDILLDEKNEIGYKSVISTIVLLKSRKTQTREEIIRQISKKLNDVTREKLLYTCILQFKNKVTEMNTKIGLFTKEYISSIQKNPCSKIQLSKTDIRIVKRKIISIDIESVELSTALKRKILENEELEVLKRVAQLEQQSQISPEKLAEEFYYTFTRIEFISVENSDFKNQDCKNYMLTAVTFRVTKMSYMIYPSSSENDLEKFKTKRNLLVKYLSIIGKYGNIDIGNHDYEIQGTRGLTNIHNSSNYKYDKYTKENNKMTQNYFVQLKTCRVIMDELYGTYIQRLKVIGCIPLSLDLMQLEQYFLLG